MWQTFNTEKYYMTSRHGKSPKKKKLTAFWHSSTHLVVALVAICTNSMGMGAWAFNHQSEVQRYGTICNTILLWLPSLLYDSNCWKILHLFLHLLLSSFYTLRGSIIIGHSDYLWQKNGERQSRKNNRPNSPTERPKTQKMKQKNKEARPKWWYSRSFDIRTSSSLSVNGSNEILCAAAPVQYEMKPSENILRPFY